MGAWLTWLWGVAALGWGTGLFLVPRLRRKADLTYAGPLPSVSVVIPARNEAHNLPRLLRSLAEQPIRPLEILVVDDASTDDTAQVAARWGAEVIPSAPLPEGWRGKPWACYQAALRARGSCLLFLDADTWFESNGLERLLMWFMALHAQSGPSGEVATQRGAMAQGTNSTHAALSLGPFHYVPTLHEQASVFFNLCMVAGTVPDRLFGPMLLVNREDYFRAGGHAGVRDCVLEHFFLTDRLRTVGVLTWSQPGKGIVAFRMYPTGWKELIEGWSKGFATGVGAVSPWVLAILVSWMVGLALAPVGWLVSGGSALWMTLYVLCGVQVYGLARCVGSFHPLTAACYPVALVFFFVVVLRSFLRRGQAVRWKGRDLPGS
ncbi:MAG: glycosyltransferase family A protein [Verrucomicrobiota bacterium]|nr:glycosyltransferase family 2 protein [Limisphaera sp.]MDW8380608.1 glycosyltransferase family A protein [Verrucomicrobiota bacterium]